MISTPISQGLSEQLTDQDRAYDGSRFSEVVGALFANPYQRVWGAPGQPAFPVHEVTFLGVLGGVSSLGVPRLFRAASARAVDSAADLRWGPDGKGFRRLVHPKGVCLIGKWQIVEETAHSGYFGQGSNALVIAPARTAMTPRPLLESTGAKCADRPAGTGSRVV